MAARFKLLRGTKDTLPNEADILRQLEIKAQDIFSIYGYRQIRTPIIESRDLFIRSLGQDTEVIGKQMFLIERDDDIIALRPEGTAGVVRSYIENSLDKTDGFAKLYYMGPMFRAERPQKGRLRQFHHIGVEAIGSNSPFLDAEVIVLADTILKGAGISGFNIKINSLGCVADKLAFAERLRVLLDSKRGLLCADCQDRYSRNVFRVLDCKNDSCREVILGLSIGYKDRLCSDCLLHFEQVLACLDSVNVRYDLSAFLVRGLDYYTRTVFEISHPDLGAQDAIGAGGRYDNLVGELGGAPSGAIGFAFGVERLLLVSKSESVKESEKNLVFLITLGREAEKKGFNLLYDLRQAGIKADTLFEEKSLKGAMRKAGDSGAKYVAILGENELKKNTVMLKDMESGEQREVKQEDLLKELQNFQYPISNIQ